MRALWGVALAGAVALTGCGDSSADEPRVLPSVSPHSASPSASPVPTGPAAAHDAAPFVRFFYAEISRGFAERDPEIVSNLSLPTCKTCKLYVDSITGVRDRNEHVQGATFKINFAVAPADTSATSARVDVGWDFPGATFFDATGKQIQESPAMKGVEELVNLNRIDGVWKVATVQRIKK